MADEGGYTPYLYGVQGLGLGALSHLVPPVAGGADPKSVGSYVPGLASYIPSGIGSLAEMGVNYIGAPVARFMQNLSPAFKSVTPTIPNEEVKIPGVQTLRELNEASVRATQDIVPHFEPTNETERWAQDIGIGAGQGAAAIVPPGIGLAPKIIGGVAKTLLPPAKLAPVGGVLGGVGGALAPPGGEEPGLNALAGKPTEEQTITALANTAEMPTAAKPVALGADGKPLPADNDTGVSMLEGAALGAAALGLTWIGAKYGHKPINFTADMLRGRSRNVTELNALVDKAIPDAEKAVEMILPGDAGGATKRWTARNINPNAGLNALADATAPADEAKLLKAANEMVNNPANNARQMEGLFRTGVEEGTGHQFPKIVDYKRSWEQMAEPEQKFATQVAFFKNELNIRDENIRINRGKGILPDAANDADIRVSFPEMSTDDMRHAVNLGESNPKIKAFMDRTRDIQMSIVDSAERRGAITPQQASRAKTVYKDFMPTFDDEGKYLHGWDDKIRTPGTGYRDIPMDAPQAMITHFDRSIRDMQKNDWQRNFVRHLEDWQTKNPTGAKLFTETAEPSGLRRSLTIQTADGPRHFDFHNTFLLDSLKANAQTMSHNAGMVNWMKQFYTNATTGPVAMMMGHPFAFKQAARDIALIPAQAPKDLWTGPISKATGVRVPLENLPGTMMTMGKDITSVFGQHFTDILGNPNNPMSKLLRMVHGDSAVDAWTDWMRTYTDTTKLAQRTAKGVGGGGNRLTHDVQAYTSDAKGGYRDPTADSVSPMMSRPNIDALPDKVPLAGNVARGTAGLYINLRTLARDLFNVISDAPHSYTHDLNVTNPKFPGKTLSAAVQGVTGNPGTRGSGLWAQKLGQIPFYNAAMQGTAASMAAFRDRPFTTGAGVIAGLLPFIYAEQLSALISGHTEHLEQQVANGTKARNTLLYHGPGTENTDHSEFTIPNEWQAVLPYMRALVGHAMGTWQAHGDEPLTERIVHTLAGMFQQHVTTDVLKQTGIGVAGQVPIDVTVPTGMAVAGITGQQVKNIPDQVVSNVIGGDNPFDRLTTGGGPDRSPPGQHPDSLLTRYDSGVMKAVMNALGAAGGVAHDLATGYNVRSRVGSDWAWTGAVEDYKQEWRDQTPFDNFVWKNNTKQSTYGSLEDRNNHALSRIQEVMKGAGELKSEGMSKATRGVPLQMTVPPSLPDDPQMRALFIQVAAAGRGIEREIQPRINQLLTQLENIKSSAFLPDERRRLHNKLSDELYDQHTKLHQRILDVNAQLSQRLGGRHIDVGQKIDWKGTVDQFHH